MRTKLASALRLFDEGYAIFPVERGSKQPLVRWSVDWATARNQVAEHWTAEPEDNIGINCGKSSLLVIDLDGDEGVANFASLWKEHERRPYRSMTRWSVTPSGGRHVWFDLPVDPVPLRNTTSGLAHKVDTRGAGGMIVAPGSEIGGRYYRLMNDLDPAPCPAWLEEKLRLLDPPLIVQMTPPVAWSEVYAWMMLAEVVPRLERVLPGGRNRQLNREAWRMRSALPKLGAEVVADKLLAAAEACGLPRDEARRTIRSGLGC